MCGFITKPLKADALAQLQERAAAHAALVAAHQACTTGAGLEAGYMRVDDA